jgi:hypothetical protein
MIEIDPPLSCVRQDIETYDTVVPIFIGDAIQLTPDYPGGIQFRFKDGDKDKIVRFDWISSAMFCDTSFWSYENYPYITDLKGITGLYEVKGSSYLFRIQALGKAEPMYLSYHDHHHYIYFDSKFNWHITARGLEFSDA